jgi:hypothetical protein
MILRVKMEAGSCTLNALLWRAGAKRFYDEVRRRSVVVGDVDDVKSDAQGRFGGSTFGGPKEMSHRSQKDSCVSGDLREGGGHHATTSTKWLRLTKVRPSRLSDKRIRENKLVPSFTLNPGPYTLKTPVVLHPTPYTLNPKP